MPPLTIHIGLGKTGTKTIQSQLLARLPGIANLGRPYQGARVMDLVQHVAIRDELGYDRAWCRRAFDEAVAPALAGGTPVVVSDERLAAEGDADRRLIAERLCDLAGPGAKVAVTLRSQATILPSMYLQEMRGANAGVAYTDLAGWLERAASRHERFRRGPLAQVDYEPLVALYERVFGPENVGLFLHEDLAARPEVFGAQLASFVGADPADGARLLRGQQENRRMAARELAYQRWRARLAPGVRPGRLLPATVRTAAKAFLRAGAPSEAPLPEAWASRLASIHGPGNRALAARHKLPLEACGYPW